MRKPVIATNVGGLREGIKDEVTGLLIPDKDVNAITKAIVTIANNPALADELGENARKYVEQERSWATVAKKLIGHYIRMTIPVQPKRPSRRH